MEPKTRCTTERTWTAGILILLTALVQSLPLSSWAQPTAAGASGIAPIEFNIPAQPLPSALNTFAETSGLQVSYPSEMASGLTSSSLVGAYTPQAGLNVLLSGTGLAYSFTEAATVTLVQGGGGRGSARACAGASLIR